MGLESVEEWIFAVIAACGTLFIRACSWLSVIISYCQRWGCDWIRENPRICQIAGYFLSQTGNLCFKSQEYIHLRAVKRDKPSCIIEEWARWVSDLRTSPNGGIRSAAMAALPLTQQDLDEYYRRQLLVGRELDAIESSRTQLMAADQQYTSYLAALDDDQDTDKDAISSGTEQGTAEAEIGTEEDECADSARNATMEPPSQRSWGKRRRTYQTEEPWGSLIVALRKVVNSQDVRPPPVSPNIPILHGILIGHAINMLEQYQKQKEKTM